MKKLIVAAAIVCAAAVSQAAAVGWNCAGADAYAGGDYLMFVVGQKGVTSAAQIKGIIEAGGSLASASAYAFGGGEVTDMGMASLPNSESGLSLTWNGDSSGDVRTGFIFVTDETGDAFSYTADKTITMKNDSTGKNFAFGNQADNFTANAFTAVPEPTSGLLLLLGVAGLALKRKRA